MIKKEFYFLSCDQKTKIHVLAWLPQQPPRGILQICHGMTEHIERYHAFASFLCEQGYLVVGHDHLGHGASVQTEEDRGYFHKTQGNAILIRDIRRLFLKVRKHFPHTPYYMLGHSMGSFLLRQYLQVYGPDTTVEGLSGAILMGTGNLPASVLLPAICLCKGVMLLKGERHRSVFLNNLAFGSYNRRFRPVQTDYDWLSRDANQVAAYAADPWCTFIFTANAYYHMFCGMLTLCSKKQRQRIPKDLPLLLVSGEADPVGNCGKGVRQVAQQYKKAGIQSVSLKLYPNDRHEILNELDKASVYHDILDWLNRTTCIV
ncbi:MAG: alpha/beta hydrolase [bacterium]|nr:alpha/beta hydrolase [bacterium]